MFRSAVLSLSLTALGCIAGCQSKPAPSSQPQTQSSSAPSPAMAVPPAQAAAISEATKASDAWLKLLDQGNYGDSWDKEAKLARFNSSKGDWCKQTAALRTAFGPVVSRSMMQADYKTRIGRGLPEGQYVTIKYATSFVKQGGGIEEVTAMREPDGEWRSLGYYISAK
jgi:hypothetical protein